MLVHYIQMHVHFYVHKIINIKFLNKHETKLHDSLKVAVTIYFHIAKYLNAIYYQKDMEPYR